MNKWSTVQQLKLLLRLWDVMIVVGGPLLVYLMFANLVELSELLHHL